jgi:hypothetical protein
MLVVAYDSYVDKSEQLQIACDKKDALITALEKEIEPIKAFLAAYLVPGTPLIDALNDYAKEKEEGLDVYD